MLAISTLFALAAVPFAYAANVPFGRPGFPGPGNGIGPRVPKLTGCDLSNVKLSLPATAAANGVAVPASEKLVFVALGRGVQNYTCTGGVYAKNMAVATMFDASCAANTPMITKLPQMALAMPAKVPNLPGPLSALIGSVKLGDHFFQNLTPGAASANPVFDWRITKKGDFIAAKKDGATPDAAPTSNIAWLQLSNVQGSLASHVFRVNTAGGLAPATCTVEGEVKTVDYAANYYFYK